MWSKFLFWGLGEGEEGDQKPCDDQFSFVFRTHLLDEIQYEVTTIKRRSK